MTAAKHAPDSITLDRPDVFLRWLERDQARVEVDELAGVDIWGLVGLAALAREGQEGSLHVRLGDGGASRFARAVGFEEAVAGQPRRLPREPHRTVPIQRVDDYRSIERTATRIAALLLRDPDQEEARRTVHYVIVELLRNAIQHSRDPGGGVVAAQVMAGGAQRPARAVQVAVADAGIGIAASLASRLGDTHPEEALEKALRPHVSGAFGEGYTGSGQNAGMGLFFISEMAKLTAGRLLVASRGASLFLEGDPEDTRRSDIRFLLPRGLGFPGTLVAFELPLETAPRDYDGLITAIAARARERTPARKVSGWLRFDEPPPVGAKRILVSIAAEDTVAAESYARDALEPVLLAGTPLALDFRRIPVATQSYLHALLFEVVRLAWARRVPIYIANARPAVRSALELLESYALGG